MIPHQLYFNSDISLFNIFHARSPLAILVLYVVLPKISLPLFPRKIFNPRNFDTHNH